VLYYKKYPFLAREKTVFGKLFIALPTKQLRKKRYAFGVFVFYGISRYASRVRRQINKILKALVELYHFGIISQGKKVQNVL